MIFHGRYRVAIFDRGKDDVILLDHPDSYRIERSLER